MNGVTDLAIARGARMRPIMEVGEERLGIPRESLDPYGRWKAKIDPDFLASLADRPRGRLVLVTAISPTPAGEGKTTTSVGLGDALNRIGRRALTCLREPSLGPCFGMKGGAAGGGRSQVVPMEDINLHFTGDFHAITAAHNLLAALVDNHIHHGAEPRLDPRRVTWNRVLDVNDRALRRIVCGLGGSANGTPRETGFDITVASEVMAILCLAEDMNDLVRRLGRVIVGETPAREPVTAADIGAAGAMAVLLKDALRPNLVQTLENNPVLVHGGPFANIAHGCNSLIATRAALGLADFVVTEAGFGADLGAEKFFDIKCRKGGLVPDAAVLVATIRALKMHGGVAKADLAAEDAGAVARGGANLARHVGNLRRFGVPVVVALNSINGDHASEVAAAKALCDELGVGLERCSHWADGGRGAESLAEAVVALAEGGEGRASFAPLYPDAMKLRDKLRTIATRIYGAADIAPEPAVERQFERFEAAGCGHFPICVAKTQYSFSADPKLLGAPEGHVLPVRELRLAHGAEFVVAICGDIMTMPGLPRHPAAMAIHIDPSGRIAGLF